MNKETIEHYEKSFERADAFESTEEYKRSIEEDLRRAVITPPRKAPLEEKGDVPF